MSTTITFGAAFSVLLLPLVCLCQFVPGQEQRAPYLLLLPPPHAHDGGTLTEEQLADLALASGLPASVTDEGEVVIGYGEGSLAGSVASGAGLTHPARPAELSPQLFAAMSPAYHPAAPGWRVPGRGRPSVAAAQFDPAPPRLPPRPA